MSRKDILNELKQIYKNIDGKRNLKNINEKSRLVHDLGMMSVSFVYMLFVIERKFNISMDNVSFSSFNTVKDVIDFIVKNTKYDITKKR